MKYLVKERANGNFDRYIITQTNQVIVDVIEDLRLKSGFSNQNEQCYAYFKVSLEYEWLN